MRKSSVTTLASCLLLALTALPSLAQSVSGAVKKISAPADTRIGKLENDNFAELFAEQQNVKLAKDLTVDLNAPGTYKAGSVPPGNIKLSAGTVVSSYYLFSDPVGTPAKGVEFKGTITFDTQILGVLTSNDHLGNTDTLLGLAPSTKYPAGSRQPDFSAGGQGDTLSLSADKKTITFDFHTFDVQDAIRILVAPVPEVSTCVGFGLGLVGLWSVLRRKKNAVL